MIGQTLTAIRIMNHFINIPTPLSPKLIRNGIRGASKKINDSNQVINAGAVSNQKLVCDACDILRFSIAAYCVENAIISDSLNQSELAEAFTNSAFIMFWL